MELKGRSHFLFSATVLLLFLSCQRDHTKEQDQDLLVLQNQYPSAFFFRSSTGMANSLEYGKWDSLFSRMGGFIGKALNEEIPGSESVIPYFTRFKQAHPEQIVLLHYNGGGLDPNDGAWNYHPSHFLYFEGCELLEDISGDTGLCEIRLEKPEIFYTGIGLNHNSNEDIGICRKTPDGKPDWDYSEQVQLVSVNHVKNSIVVKRAQYNSEALEFRAGETLLCPHVYQGPWGGRDNHLMWSYNHSTKCPADENGKTCDDILTDYFAGLFGKDGRLELFDGVEFDVLYAEVQYQTFGRLADVDCDGRGDGGIVNGVNVYTAGVFNLCRLLREKLGPDKLILADCNHSRQQRGVPYLNGIESEGWPYHRDSEVRDWSGGWNRHLFWNQNACEPRFSFVNFKYVGIKEPPPITRQRLVWGTTFLLDASLTGIYPERARGGSPGRNFEIIDEIVGGEKQEPFWLGEALGDAVRMALDIPDLLEGDGASVSDEFLATLSGTGVNFSRDNGHLLISGSPGQPIIFSIANIPCNGPDLVLSFDIRGDYMAAYPEGMPRAMHVWSSEDDYRLMTFLNDEWFRSVFYFRDIESDSITIYAEIESGENVRIRDLTAHAYPDVVYREFENGLVLVNPAHHSHTFSLKSISPGRKYRKLTGTEGQDRMTNNGEGVEDTITLGEREGIFLIVDK